MDKQVLLFTLLMFFLFTIFKADVASSSCPLDLSYVETFPWDTSSCRDPIDTQHCCETLLTLFGIGLAQHLKETSLFQLPDENTSSTCLSDFKVKLSSMSIQPSLVPSCFHNSTQFVTNSSSCAGIITTKDWKQKVGMLSSLDTSCKGDMNDQTRCSICIDAGLKVTSQLTSIDPKNATKCFYFTILYAAAVVNQFGPTDVGTASCILGLPLSKGHHIHDSSGGRE
ncbi:probable receptor-like protein kinase At1g11050 [Gastrolobium bilobum]|uniref:probable receptor-like protein kinase At1g11050 n=1 Tax=Gastrolobium bilobum TaxID=150636 RepID=UPI002AAFAB5F|nr:probable receptor-like protein kinase At1g11050 [Gastrolobium bilobum]